MVVQGTKKQPYFVLYCQCLYEAPSVVGKDDDLANLVDRLRYSGVIQATSKPPVKCRNYNVCSRIPFQTAFRYASQEFLRNTPVCRSSNRFTAFTDLLKVGSVKSPIGHNNELKIFVYTIVLYSETLVGDDKLS